MEGLLTYSLWTKSERIFEREMIGLQIFTRSFGPISIHKLDSKIHEYAEMVIGAKRKPTEAVCEASVLRISDTEWKISTYRDWNKSRADLCIIKAI